MHTASNRLLWILLAALLPARIVSAQIGPSGGAQYVHDVGLTIATTQGPITICRASAAAPAAVSADDDPVLQWCLRNGAGAVVLTAAGALIGGDAAFGLDIDVLRFPDNEPFNVAQINGVTPLMGNGTTGTGSPRVTIASDNTAFTVNIGTFPDNEPFNAAQWGGTAVTGGSGNMTAGTPRVNIALDDPVNDAAVELAAAINSSIVDVNVKTIDGVTPSASACDDPSKVTMININLGAGTGNTEIVALNGSTRIYLCGINFLHDGAGTLQLINGTGTACATGETDMATWTFSATTGYGLVMSASPGGYGRTDAGDALCVERSASVTLTGVASVIQQ